MFRVVQVRIGRSPLARSLLCDRDKVIEQRMIQSQSRAVLLVLTCVMSTAAAADGGDDFSNNLFSDLAPLLTLFGEQVAMQFLSQSMGWADNIIFAVAPLGKS